MLRTCARCGTLHNHNYVCTKGKSINKKDTEANRFRRTTKWTKKSNDIRSRDNYLCRCCIAQIYETTYQYNYKDLGVHHIVPLEEDFDLRLDDDNLITLCPYHHQLSEDGIIDRDILRLLTNPETDLYMVKEIVTPVGIPRTFDE